MTRVVNIAQSGGNNVTMRNRIINGAMVIDQRNAGASVTPIDGQYTLDRWVAWLTQSSKLSVQQSSVAPEGFSSSMLVTSLSAYSVGTNDEFELTQKIEGYNVADLAFGTASAKTITVSFWVRSSLTGTFSIILAANNVSRTYPASYTISSANTWQYVTITIPGDTSGTWLTNNGWGLSLGFNFGAGTGRTTTSGWSSNTSIRAVTGQTNFVATNGATMYITGVQLEAGTTATPFEQRLYGTELALCQRYFFKITPSSNFAPYTMGHAFNTTQVRTLLKFPQTMRSSPTLGFSAANTFQIGWLNVISSIAQAEMGVDCCSVDAVSTGLTQWGAYMITSANNTTSYITGTAEL